MARKRKPLKRATKTTAEIKRVRAEVDKIRFGDEARVTRKTERAAARSKRAIPKPPEVAPANDPRSLENLTVAIYKGAGIADDQLPGDLLKWKDFRAKYAERGAGKGEDARIRAILCGGFPVAFKKLGFWYTAYAVLEKGRARDDIARAAGSLLEKYKALH